MRSRPSPPSPWDSTPSRRWPNGISPASIAVCSLATIVALPVLFATRGSGSGQDVTVAAVAPEPSQAVTVSEIDVDVSRLFDAGADATEMSSDGLLDANSGANLERDYLSSELPLISTSTTLPDRERLSGASSSAPDPAPTDPSTGDAPSTAAPTTAAPTTAAPTTAAPTTAAPTTAAPTTAAPTTAAPTTTIPVLEEPMDENPDDGAPEDPANGEPTAEQWANLRQCESGGNYSIVSGNGLYHGAYQFGIRTWDGVASSSGRSDLVGVRPSDAAPADQDALALALWRSRGSQPWPHCGKYLH